MESVNGVVLRGDAHVEVQPQQVHAEPVRVFAPAGITGRQPLRFTVEAVDGSTRRVVDSSFFGPM